MELALNLFLAGFVIVFIVLLLLIFIVKIYGTIVQAGIKAAKDRKDKKEAAIIKTPETDTSTQSPVKTSSVVEEDDGSIPGEIIAAIAAAVDAVYGNKPHRIKSVKRTKSTRSAWASAGLRDNTRPF